MDLPQKTRDTTKFAQPWWNLPQNLLAAQDGSAPEDQRHHETCATLAKPWRNLGGTFRGTLAAQDGYGPENHRESEGNSAPKPLLWLKTPKLLLLGKNQQRAQNWLENDTNMQEKGEMTSNSRCVRSASQIFGFLSSKV